ncbi:hypothetical protein GCK32_017423, partial [Trichostrongylus colubriformis]
YCSNNDDCGVNGLCQTSPTDGSKQCFCVGGRYGDYCEKESPAIKSNSDFDESLYNMKEVENNKIFWRILDDEIEVVLRYPGESWVALGWKPQDAQCPQISDQFKTPSPTAPPSTTTHTLHKVEIKPPELAPSSTRTTTTTTRTMAKSTTRPSTTTTSITTKPHTVEAGKEDCGPNEQWSSCPEMSRDCEPSCDWTRFPETIPNCP